MTEILKSFDAITVPLKGRNLIEASAGTGKTHSIAILVLRLILEEGIDIKSVLMVTYTKAAVAELQERIRRFVRDAYRYSKGENIDDADIKKIVDENREVEKKLRTTVLLLDETSVLTIHSFCQQALTEFAFETKQSFGAEAQTDFSFVIEEEVNKFWRKNVTSISVPLLKALLDSKFAICEILNIVIAHLKGKSFYAYSEQDNNFCEADFKKWENEILEIIKSKEDVFCRAEEHIRINLKDIKAKCEGHRYATTSFLGLINSPADFFEMVIIKSDKAYVNKLFPELLILAEEIIKLNSEEENILINIKNVIYCLAISEVSKGLEEYKKKNNFYAFDDMIANLHNALKDDKYSKLKSAVQNKYRAVFVDEFQDTDKLQYEIFKMAFFNDNPVDAPVVFFIGDPKQSIYTFRNADIITYFEAKSAVDNVYDMKVNYRSTGKYIEGLNKFYEIEDPFYFKDSEGELKYSIVEASPKKAAYHLKFKENPDAAFSIFNFDTKPEIALNVANLVNTLLDGNSYFICDENEKRNIKPSDIGILVRGNRDGRNIKYQLAIKGIPAVTVDDQKVLQTEEAKFVLYLLLAIDNFSLQNINQALLNPVTGISSAEILKLSEDKCIELFKKYKLSWDEDGLYTALMLFAADFDIRRKLLKPGKEHGERMLTNFFQLIELMHKVQTEKSFSNAETINWLSRATSGMEIEGDEYAQRIESDEEAVNIVTIHKSKGLDYNIVILPGLDFQPYNPKRKIASFRNDKGKYVSKYLNQLTEDEKENLIEQGEQENRRLIYVATTRAVYKCFIFKNKDKVSSITNFLNLDEKYLSRLKETHFNNEFRYKKDTGDIPAKLSLANNFSLDKVAWQKTSYTNLSGSHSSNVKKRVGLFANEYDEFIFKGLIAGAHTGNMLHFIFENLNFSVEEKWDATITEAVSRFYPSKDLMFNENLNKLLVEVLKTKIPLIDPFSLNEISNGKHIHEFEFDFSVPLINPTDLNSLTDDERIINVKNIYELEGIMNGKIDLFFEHANKFYVLDWKSNFLGDSLDDYKVERLNDAMNENNYHLQYLIYTLAITKFLKSRNRKFDYEKDFGGVIYLFVRGMRSGSDNGIFFYKPSKDLISKVSRLLGEKL